ncbi:MAG TPA: hypothetical protein VF292_15955 [Rhodanobacteraceae bacterium]
MLKHGLIACGVVLALCAAGTALAAPQQQRSPTTAQLLQAEAGALAPLAEMEGVWRGTASMMLPSGKRHVITQTERVGPFLGKSVLVMEGRGYESDGRVSFNALGIIAYDPMTRAYSMHSYAQGYAGTFKLQLTRDGFTWSIPEGPVTMRYTATIRDGTWHETGERVMPGGKSVPAFSMTLKRTGSTDWPAAGAVPFKP